MGQVSPSPPMKEQFGVHRPSIVLEQMRIADPLNIIDLDPASEVDDPVSEPNTTNPGSTVAHTSREVENGTSKPRIVSCSTLTPKKGSEDTQGPRAKTPRRLFRSKEAMQTAVQSAGIMTPPSSDTVSPTLSFSEKSKDEGTTSWAFDVEGLERRLPDLGIELAEKVLLDGAHLVAAYGGADVITSLDATSPEPTHEYLHGAKSVAEAKGIAKSQQLRAQRKATVHAEAAGASYHSAATNPSRKRSFEAALESGQNSGNDDAETHNIWTLRDEALVPHGRKRCQSSWLYPKRTKHLGTALHPASREAAEQFRTQSRHCDRDAQKDEAYSANLAVHESDFPEKSSEEVRRREERLARIRASAHGHFRKNPRQSVIREGTGQSNAKASFFAPDLEKRTKVSKPDSRLVVKQVRDNLRKMMDVSSPPPDEDKGGSDDKANSSASGSTQSLISVLEQLQKMTGVQPSRPGHDDAKGLYSSLPDQGLDEHLALPKQFESWSRERQERVRRREVLKEREIDLRLILDCFTDFARLLSVDDLHTRYMSQLEEMKQFSVAVLDNNKSGKRARGRIRDIRNRIRRRFESTKIEPELGLVDEQLRNIMKSEYMHRIQTELPEIRAKTIEIQAEVRNDSLAFKKKSEEKRKQRPAKAPYQRSQEARNAYYRSLNRRMNNHRAQLAAFERRPERGPNDGDEIDPENIELPSLIDEDGATSEEDEGEHLVGNSEGPSQILNNNNLNAFVAATTAENKSSMSESPKHLTALATQGSLLDRLAAKASDQAYAQLPKCQQADPKLLEEMKHREAARAAERTRLESMVDALSLPETQCVHAEVDEAEPEVESERDFDDSDLEEDGKFNDEIQDGGVPQCKRYHVKASIAGLGPHYDEEILLLGRFLRRSKAIKKVLSLGPWFRTELAKLHPETSSPTAIFSTTLKDTGKGYEQFITVGEDAIAGCRTWIEEETFTPSQEAYQRAKVEQACQLPDMWFVDWEMTLEPLQEDADNESETQDAVDAPKVDESQGMAVTTPSAPIENSSQTLEEGTVDDRLDKLYEDNDTQPPVLPNAKQPASVSISASASSLAATPLSTLPTISRSPNHQPEAVASSSSCHNTLTTITERPIPTSLRFYTSLALANRHAKNRFMAWFCGQLPGRANEGYLRLEDESIEEQLRQIGDRDAWQRDEAFDRIDEEGRKWSEKFWVRVRKCSGWGGRN